MEQQKKRKSFAIAGLVMALVAIIVDYFIFQGVDGEGISRMGEVLSYGFVAEMILFPIMITGIILFAINLYCFIKQR